MKNFKRLFVLVIALMLVVPFTVFADEEKEPVKVYLFHGNGCSHCAETREWFDSIEEEYGDYFDLVKFEVWYNDTNREFMNVVADKMGDEAGGVPYMVVGKYSFPNGFAPNSPSGNGEKTMAEDMIDKIMETYNDENRVDVMEGLDMPEPDKEEATTTTKTDQKDEKGNAVVGIVSVVVIGGIIALSVVTRKNNQ